MRSGPQREAVRADSAVASGATAWPASTVVVAFIGACGLAIAGRAVVAGDMGLLLATALALVVLNAAPVGLAVMLARRQGEPSAADFGLRRPALRRAIGLSIAVWVALTALSILWFAAIGLDEARGQTLTGRLGTEGTLRVLTLIVVLSVLTPLGEEVLFRGYIFRALRNRYALWPAALGSGLLFAASHIGWSPVAFLLPVALFGIGMCLLYAWTGSLYPGIGLHALNNAIPLRSSLDLTWQSPLLLAGAAIAALALAWLIGRRLDDRDPTAASSST